MISRPCFFCQVCLKCLFSNNNGCADILDSGSKVDVFDVSVIWMLMSQHWVYSNLNHYFCLSWAERIDNNCVVTFNDYISFCSYTCSCLPWHCQRCWWSAGPAAARWVHTSSVGSAWHLSTSTPTGRAGEESHWHANTYTFYNTHKLCFEQNVHMMRNNSKLYT